MSDEIACSATEVEQAAWICVKAMWPTDATQAEANALGLLDALADWSAPDLRQLVGTIAALAAHWGRTLEANHREQQDGDS